MSTAPPRFRAETGRLADGTRYVTITGELEMYTTPNLKARLPTIGRSIAFRSVPDHIMRLFAITGLDGTFTIEDR